MKKIANSCINGPAVRAVLVKRASIFSKLRGIKAYIKKCLRIISTVRYIGAGFATMPLYCTIGNAVQEDFKIQTPWGEVNT